MKNIPTILSLSPKGDISQKMHFSYSDSDNGTYLNSRWSNNISQLLQGTLIDILERSKLFKVVLTDSSTVKEDYRLESNIFIFEHEVREKQSHSVVSIQFTLIDADTGKVLKNKRFSYREKTTTIDAKGYVVASNIIIEKLARDLIAWLQ